MAEKIVKFGDWINEGWKLFTDKWQTWVGATAIMGGLIGLPMMLLIVFGVYVPLIFNQEPSPNILFALLLLTPLLMFGGILMSGGLHRMAYKQLRGDPISWRDIFSCVDCVWSLVGASLLVGLATILGALLCYFPAFIVGGLMFFVFPLIVEKRLGVFDAIQQSIDLAKKDWLMFTLFALVLSLIASAGSSLCYVGMLVTWPLYFTISAVAYRDCFGVAGARPTLLKPEAAVPNIYASAATPQEAMESPHQPIMHCRFCGTYMPSYASFCPQCGRTQ